MAKSESWQKTMQRYGQHCYSDAHSLAEWLTQEVNDTLPAIRRRFDGTDRNILFRFEIEHEDVISDLIKRSDSQRPAIFRKFRKAHGEEALERLLLISIIVAVRLDSIIGLRDIYRGYLVPGGGYRVTAKSFYVFSRHVLHESLVYEWPAQVFDNLGIDDWDDEDESWLDDDT
jgi:hypothetical protein